jgi:hypothetical protein
MYYPLFFLAKPTNTQGQKLAGTVETASFFS